MALKHSVYDTDTHFIIDGDTRVMKNASTVKTVLVQGDHNSERITFELPRQIDGHDMSLCDAVEVHYINTDGKVSNKGVYDVEDLQISPDDDSVVIFSWLISANATQISGTLNFLVRFVCLTNETIDYAWSTTIFKNIAVSEGMNNGEAVVAEYADVLETWKRELKEEIVKDVLASIPTAEEGVSV